MTRRASREDGRARLFALITDIRTAAFEARLGPSPARSIRLAAIAGQLRACNPAAPPAWVDGAVYARLVTTGRQFSDPGTPASDRPDLADVLILDCRTLIDAWPSPVTDQSRKDIYG